jgi:hypothetical protein
MDGTPEQICFRDVTDFSPAAANDLRESTPTLANFDLTSVTNNSYRQSAKVDLGAKRAVVYRVRAALEFATAPTAGNVVEFYWAPSPSPTAGTANPGNASGSDAAYTGYSSNADASIKQCDFIGNFICTSQATGTIQVAEVGILCPSERYGSLIVKNASGATLMSDAVEMHVVFDPIIDEIQ